MEKITTIPYHYDSLNHLALRSRFENNEEDSMIGGYLAPVGYAGDLGYSDTWAIDFFNEDLDFIESFLYVSEYEYKQDCLVLGINPNLEKDRLVAVMLNTDPLTAEDKQFIEVMRELSARNDRLLGKPIIGVWLPIGMARDPDTADDPELARVLMKDLLKRAEEESINNHLNKTK